MTTASLVYIHRALGKPEPAILVDKYGNQVLAASHPEPETWMFATEIDSDRFRNLVLNQAAVAVGLAVVPAPYSVSVFVVAHQVDDWEHRLLIPLAGNIVKQHLESLLREGAGIKISFGDESTDLCIEFVTEPCTDQLELALAHCVKHSYRSENASSTLNALGAQYRLPEQFSSRPSRSRVRHVQVSAVLIPELQLRP